MKNVSRGHDAQTVGLAALDSYARVLTFLTQSGRSRRGRVPAPAELPFLESVPGIEKLYRSMSAVAAATPDSSIEEWNPLSQRPHSPLPPPVADELGVEVTALKEAIDAFSTMCHEMMHVALWEPFFTGRWQPRSAKSFRAFSLMAEGFCFFFADIVVSGAVRVRLPDGEFAMERQSPSNARFHPTRAFQALGIEDPEAILGIYLEGFSGRRTALWQPRGTNNFVAAMAAQVYDFYAGSLRYLDELHGAISAFGGLTEFYRRFCAVPGLPTFIDEEAARLAGGKELGRYFSVFFRRGLKNLGAASSACIDGVRWRRMLQMRAYYALQVRWLLREDLVVARGWPAPRRREVLGRVEAYLEGLAGLLQRLARQPEIAPAKALAKLDADYATQARAEFLAHDVWAGQRSLILPRRAGGRIGVFDEPPAKARAGRIKLLETVAFLVDELTRRMKESRTVEARADLLGQIQRVAAIGAAGGAGNAADMRAAARRLTKELGRPALLAIWSVPLASFDPVGNGHRELVFSYQ